MNNTMYYHPGVGEAFHMFGPWFGLALVVLIVWSLAWKGTALWYAARNHQRVWFIMLLILNTLGILEILYIIFWRKNNNESVTTTHVTTTTTTSTPTPGDPSSPSV